MNHHPCYIATMQQLLPLLRRQRTFEDFSFEAICDYFAFGWNRGTFAYVADEEGSPRGAVLIRIFEKLNQFMDPFIHVPHGTFLMVDMFVAEGPTVMARLYYDVVNRWGPRMIVLWDRGERTQNKEPRMFTWPQFERLARRITYGKS